MEQAAQSSYAYWLATLSDKPPTAYERRKMALRECRRHILKRTLEEATGDILETMKYRKVRKKETCVIELGMFLDFQTRQLLILPITYHVYAILAGPSRRSHESIF